MQIQIEKKNRDNTQIVNMKTQNEQGLLNVGDEGNRVLKIKSEEYCMFEQFN